MGRGHGERPVGAVSPKGLRGSRGDSHDIRTPSAWLAKGHWALKFRVISSPSGVEGTATAQPCSGGPGCAMEPNAQSCMGGYSESHQPFQSWLVILLLIS